MIAYEVVQEQEEPGRGVARSGKGESKDVHSVPDRKTNCQLEFQEIVWEQGNRKECWEKDKADL